MKHTLFIASTGPGAGLTSVSIGLVRALDRLGLRIHFAKPISQPAEGDVGPERSTSMLRNATQLDPPDPITLQRAQNLMNEGNEDDLMEEIVALVHGTAGESEITVVEGLIPTTQQPYADELNAAMAKALDAEVILVGRLGTRSVSELDEGLETAARLYGGLDDPKIIGAIINKINVPIDQYRNVGTGLDGQINPLNTMWLDDLMRIQRESHIFQRPDFKLIGGIPWQQNLVSPRVSDLAAHLNAQILNSGEISKRRVDRYTVVARTLPNMVHTLKAGSLFVTPSDREDIILAVSMSALSGTQIAGLVLTGGYPPNPRVMELCRQALATGLPVMQVDTDTYETANRLQEYNNEVPLDDGERIGWVMDHVARQLDSQWLQSYSDTDREPRLSPPAFRYKIAELARSAHKRIILPEGDEPRTIQAAAICHERNIAQCMLMANPQRVEEVARANGVELPKDLIILDPEPLRNQYVDLLVELRHHKGMARPMAIDQVRDNVMLGTLMLYKGEVDGLVSGAVHTTANTIRPALQLIKTRPGAKLVSSVFFMCLPEQVLVYGDCAINPDPTAEELADIAIQSADSAAAFGIPPRVAMISYSTGSSGTGSDVDKVREATAIAQVKRPDLLIDGPLQYDAAAIADVAATKAPNSPVAGRATVFIFPDLNTGNTTYKAVQRSANVVSIGPMLQGMRKPVNDLSRGALVDDIVYTIALTAIQAEQVERVPV
ncbi:MAG: phosphate acetyltransferase [Ardenticatenaceae bacterium]|nr:phosphate acetyltransferase [Ardenticatenaceae bacterium]